MGFSRSSHGRGLRHGAPATLLYHGFEECQEVRRMKMRFLFLGELFIFFNISCVLGEEWIRMRILSLSDVYAEMNACLEIFMS